MRIIRVDDQPDVPWKNGGGTTRELLSAMCGPAAFDWRVSVATIERNGPFSSFPGVDRTLIGLEGTGRVEISGRLAQIAPQGTVRFGGDEPIFATVRTAPIRVLNIMSAKRDWRQDIVVTHQIGVAPWRDDHPRMFAILCSDGDAEFRPGDLILDTGKGVAIGGVIAVEITFIPRSTPI